jgi:hypothetical protein
MSANLDIKTEVKSAGLKLWQIAYEMGIQSDSNFSRKLRRELPAAEKDNIRQIIARLAAQREQEAI